MDWQEKAYALNQHSEKFLREHGEVCDFCAIPPATWVHFTDKFTIPFDPPIPGLKGMHCDPEWAVCDECHKLIEAEDKVGLAKRASEFFIEAQKIKGFKTIDTVEGIETSNKIHDAFFAHRRKDRKPINIRAYYKP